MQEKLNNYFSTKWKSKFEHYRVSGYSLADQINDDQHVLDVGCGINPFKGRIKNLIGIDPVFKEADIKTTIEDLNVDQKFDVAFCLDTLIFGDRERVLHQLDCVTKHLNPSATIHFRSNSDIDSAQYQKEGIEIFNWSQTEYMDLAEQFGFTIFILHADTYNSVHAVWVR